MTPDALVVRARVLHALGAAGGSLRRSRLATILSDVAPEAIAAAVETLGAEGLVRPGGILRPGSRGSLLSAARVRERLAGRPDREIEVRAAVESTNDVAMERALAGASPGLVIAAELQTRGRGTKGRAFLSPPGLGIWSTTLLDAPGDPASAPRTSLVAALAVAAAVERATGVPPGLKWPNDVRIAGRKVCGVLVEARSRGAATFLVAGIGVNVHHRREDFPAELRPLAGSLEERTGTRLERSALLAAIVTELEAHVTEDRRGALDLAARWAVRDELAGREVEVRTGAAVLAGTAEGLEEDGRLRLRGPGGSVRALRSGEAAVAIREE